MIRRRTTAADLLTGWQNVLHAWPGARWQTLVEVSSSPPGGQVARPVAAPVVRLSFPGGPRRALLIAGTHGDEPAGPRGLLRFFASGGATARRSRWSFDVLPLVNPLGFDRGTRGRRGCRDLNRAFGTPPRCPETAAILDFVGAAPLAAPTAAELAADSINRHAEPAPAPRWDVALSLHEDGDARCLYCYDTGDRERHRFVAGLHETVAFLDWAEAHGTPVCDSDTFESAPNRGGVLIGAQQAFPALEPLLFRARRARRVIIVETPGQSSEETRERLHVAALRHFLRADASSDVTPRERATVFPH